MAAELEEEKKLRENLEKINPELAEKHDIVCDMLAALHLEKPKPQSLDAASITKWRKQTRAMFDTIRESLALYGDDMNEKVTIKLPNRFVLQQFFNEMDAKAKKSGSFNNATVFFRDFDRKGMEDENDYRHHSDKYKNSHKLFLDWDVQYDGKLFFFS